MIQPLLSLALIAYLSGHPLRSDEPASTPPRLSVGDVTVSPSGREVLLHVALDNSSRGCRPVIISDTYFAFADDRPLTLLAFDIRNEKGEAIHRSPQLGGTRPRYAVGNLLTLTLRCGASYGWWIALGKPDWVYALGPGKYTLRARVENRVRSFFARQPRELRRLLDATLLDREAAMAVLWDFAVTSDEITIEIESR